MYSYHIVEIKFPDLNVDFNTSLINSAIVIFFGWSKIWSIWHPYYENPLNKYIYIDQYKIAIKISYSSADLTSSQAYYKKYVHYYCIITSLPEIEFKSFGNFKVASSLEQILKKFRANNYLIDVS